MRLLAALLTSAVLLAPAAALAAASPHKCNDKAAAHVVEKFRTPYFYAKGKRVRVIDNVDCEAKRSRKGRAYHECDVYASTGAALATWSSR